MTRNNPSVNPPRHFLFKVKVRKSQITSSFFFPLAASPLSVSRSLSVGIPVPLPSPSPHPYLSLWTEWHFFLHPSNSFNTYCVHPATILSDVISKLAGDLTFRCRNSSSKTSNVIEIGTASPYSPTKSMRARHRLPILVARNSFPDVRLILSNTSKGSLYDPSPPFSPILPMFGILCAVGSDAVLLAVPKKSHFLLFTLFC